MTCRRWAPLGNEGVEESTVCVACRSDSQSNSIASLSRARLARKVGCQGVGKELAESDPPVTAVAARGRSETATSEEAATAGAVRASPESQ